MVTWGISKITQGKDKINQGKFNQSKITHGKYTVTQVKFNQIKDKVTQSKLQTLQIGDLLKFYADAEGGGGGNN